MSIAFRDLPVYDLLGATRNFEQLTPAITALEERKNFKPGTATAQAARETSKEFEASATQDALVLLQLNSKAAEVLTTVTFKVGAVTVGQSTFPKLAEVAVQTVTIPVPAGKKWEAKLVEGALSAFQSSYTFLD